MSRGTVARLNTGHIPNSDQLRLIARAENTSLDWLLTGRGEPFVVGRYDSDADMASDLHAYLSDESWEVFVVTGGEHPSLLLLLPEERLVGKKVVSYTLVDIFVGPAGQETAHVLRDHHVRGRHLIHHLPLPIAAAHRLARGRIGNKELLDKDGGLLSERIEDDIDVALEQMATGRNAGMTEPERTLLQHYRDLSPSARDHVAAVAQAFDFQEKNS